MNAAGKGECTKHAYRCGGGSGIFFLLQECIGLIMHGMKAAYVHSPYVDSHGETPHYRGRPLNLDLDRYNTLHVAIAFASMYDIILSCPSLFDLTTLEVMT